MAKKILSFLVCLLILAGLFAFSPAAKYRLFVHRVLVGEAPFPGPAAWQKYVIPHWCGKNIDGCRQAEKKTHHFQMPGFKLGGLPFHQTTVQAAKTVKVIPGGQSIGIVLKQGNVVAAGYAPVTDASGNRDCPACRAGIGIGDVILSINGIRTDDADKIGEIINRAGFSGQIAVLEIKRGNRIKSVRVKPILSRETGSYRIGLYLKSGTQGVGTMTFYDLRTRRYAALGHPITDARGEKILSPAGGRIVRARVLGVIPGRKGFPGEKIGTFVKDREEFGSIDDNNRCGIWGKLKKVPAVKGSYMPVALAQQVHTGMAQILTVVHGEQVERFNIVITKVEPDAKKDGRGLVIKINDQRLLSLTGGIIQGMSGSPIIQDGRLAGAVTHVFVQDPTRGYGILAEWMVKSAGFFYAAF